MLEAPPAPPAPATPVGPPPLPPLSIPSPGVFDAESLEQATSPRQTRSNTLRMLLLRPLDASAIERWLARSPWQFDQLDADPSPPTIKACTAVIRAIATTTPARRPLLLRDRS